ncbi:DUF885 domain-containing protein [Streptomyces sp. A7024]|uniref:DUF885 domain-containing protein n=1 Tax=Streptomyces coryli TaxID=1128680 RepID=A0A6G4U542_9ACTN|nr:DUF885 family protein [Streptomyces coryli]NGN66836.1 DUF885 domain-containing protein [Streptomyces coryli]
MDHRLRAICDLTVRPAREEAGHHGAYDGRLQDLSGDGIGAGLRALSRGPAYDDPHDEAHARTAEEGLRARYRTLAQHRTNPFLHIDNLDIAGYDRPYAPAAERAAARRAHLDAWPDALDTAVRTLDAVAAPAAQATLPAARALAAALADDEKDDRTLSAHARFVAHLEHLAAHGDPDARLGGAGLRLLLSAAEGCPVDLTELADRARREKDRLTALLRDSADRLAPGRPLAETLAAVRADHPAADGLVAEVRELAHEVLAWTAAAGVAPTDDGVCETRPAPPSRRYAFAMLNAAAPYETDGPSRFYVTPPDPAWPPAEREQWLSFFNRAFLPAFVLHEVAPGHFTHGRALRGAASEVRRTLQSTGFTEGWAVYAEQLALEAGFRAGDPRFALGVALSGLQRAVRLECSIGLHTGALSVADAARLFAADAHLAPKAARAEAERGLWDPEYGHYTWGKLAILDLRDRARTAWGGGFTLRRFHDALLALGAPPLGLLDTALERG